jgi:hypothetical protein
VNGISFSCFRLHAFCKPLFIFLIPVPVADFWDASLFTSFENYPAGLFSAWTKITSQETVFLAPLWARETRSRQSTSGINFEGKIFAWLDVAG